MKRVIDRKIYNTKTAGRLFYHKTYGGAEYLCRRAVIGTTEGDLRFSVVRLDGSPQLLGVYLAAPDLLAALEMIGAEIQPGYLTAKHVAQIRAAIAKAKGE